jgi:tetratricopeptide (TPR) repeat protein
VFRVGTPFASEARIPMFEFGRELRRWFAGEILGPAHDGLTGGDGALLELLELDLLRAEARSADIAAGRMNVRDRPQRQLEAAVVWREIARRTGDALALRKAAAYAERAASGFGRETRPRRWAGARCEQALATLTGASLFGDEGLDAAADFALVEAQRAAGASLPGVLAQAGRAHVAARAAMVAGDHADALQAAARFDGPIRALDTLARRGVNAAKLLAAGARIERAECLITCGQRLKDADLLRFALAGLDAASSALDAAYEPLTWARTALAVGQARAVLGDLTGDIGEISGAIEGLVTVLEHISRDHSPLDWAGAQLALAGALQALGEAGDNARAFDQALGCYDRALMVLGDTPELPLRACAAHERVTCLVRRAELSADLEMLDEAEASLRVELTLADAAKDPVAWAVRQLSYAQICEARMAVLGSSEAETDASVGMALSAALEVFGDHGRRTLADAAARGLERMRFRMARA